MTRKRNPKREEVAVYNSVDDRSTGAAGETTSAPVVSRPQNSQPLLEANTREKLLYKIACTGLPLGAEFFDNFKDPNELAQLAFSLALRRLAVMVSNPDHGDVKDVLAAARVLAGINGVKEPSDADRFVAPPPLAIPTGGTTDVEQTLAKMRELSGGANGQ